MTDPRDDIPDMRTTEQRAHDEDFDPGEVGKPSVDLIAEAGLDTWTGVPDDS